MVCIISTDLCQPPCGVNGACDFDSRQCNCASGYTGITCDDGKFKIAKALSMNNYCVQIYRNAKLIMVIVTKIVQTLLVAIVVLVMRDILLQLLMEALVQVNI